MPYPEKITDEMWSWIINISGNNISDLIRLLKLIRDIHHVLGEEITIRFNFVTDGEVRADGFYFDDLTINVIDNEALGNSDIIESSFGVHPNPLKNFLYITTPKNNYKISIYNIHGQLIRTPSTYSGSQTIDYGSLSKGIYLMKISYTIKGENKSIIKKIIKK